MKILKNQPNEINFDQRYNLAKIKQECYQMIARSGKGEELAYYELGDCLGNLSFIENSCEEYKQTLLQVIEEMILLDDLSFDIDRLYSIRTVLQ